MRKAFSTLATHATDALEEVSEQPLSAPIWQVGDYAYDSAEHYADVINERRQGQVYGRYGSPTVELLAKVLSQLERADSGWIFSSGMGAIHAVLMHFTGSGGRLVAARTLYGGSYGLLTQGAARAGIDVSFADATDAGSIEQAIGSGADAVFIETIANPTFEVADIEGISAVCRGRSVPLVVDNTVATPALVNPHEFGADVVVHSTSKYIGGHHDLMGGAVTGAASAVDQIRHLGIRYGTTASGFESWLALRGVATLGVRMERHCASAFAIASAMQDSGTLESVVYPGLETHPQHDRAKKLMRSFGGMIALDLGSQSEAWSFMDALEIARVGSSFGGVRTEVTHPATTSHRQFSAADREAAGITDGLVRVSVGLEDLVDLLPDFQQALKKAIG